jgi:hypothetical protein
MNFPSLELEVVPLARLQLSTINYPTITAEWSCGVGKKPLDYDQVFEKLIPFPGFARRARAVVDG